MLATVDHLAALPLPALPPVEEGHLAECLRFMQAALPRRAADDLAGAILVKAYRRKLGHMPREQVSFLTDQALERCRWFPTIAECVEIAAEWRRDDDDTRSRVTAQRRARDERLARLDEARRALRAGSLGQDAIDALPERALAILTTDGLLWRCADCGSHTARPVAPAPQMDDDLSGALARMAAKFESVR